MEAIFKGTEEAPQLRIRRGGFSYTQESCSSDLKGSKVSIRGKSRRQRNIEDVRERGKGGGREEERGVEEIKLRREWESQKRIKMQRNSWL